MTISAKTVTIFVTELQVMKKAARQPDSL